MAEEQIGYGAGGKSYATGKKKIPIAEYEKMYPGRPYDAGLTEAQSAEGQAFYFNPQTGKYEQRSDISIYEEERGLLGETVKNVEEQAKAAQMAIGAAEQAGSAAQRAARMKAAQSLSAFRGMGEGGRGFSLSQEAAAKAGMAEGAILAQTAEEVAGRTAEAKEAQTQAGIARKKLLEQEKAYGQEAIDAATDAQAVVETIGGPMRTTSDDITKIVSELQMKMNAAVSPKAKAAYQKVIDSINNKTLDAPGMDTWKM